MNSSGIQWKKFRYLMRSRSKIIMLSKNVILFYESTTSTEFVTLVFLISSVKTFLGPSKSLWNFLIVFILPFWKRIMASLQLLHICLQGQKHKGSNSPSLEHLALLSSGKCYWLLLPWKKFKKWETLHDSVHSETSAKPYQGWKNVKIDPSMRNLEIPP